MDDATGEMKDEAPEKPWDPAFIKRVTEANNTFDTALMDTRFRVGHVTRQLLAQGKHLTMNQAEYEEVEKSIQALAAAFDTVANAIEQLRQVSAAEVWVSRDVSKIAKNLAALVHAMSDLDAIREVPAPKLAEASVALRQCGRVLLQGGDVLKLVRELTGIELGVNNLGMSSDEFKRLAGLPKAPTDSGPHQENQSVGETDAHAWLNPEKGPLLPVEITARSDELLKKVGVWAKDARDTGERLRRCSGCGAFEERKASECGHCGAKLDKVCEACGLDDPPRGVDILPVVEKRGNGRTLCITCAQVKSDDA